MEYVKKIIGFVIGFAVVSGIFYFVRGGDKLKEFEPYHSEEGRFSVSFPGEPESKTEQVETPVGTLEFVMYSAGSRKTGFIVAYVDYSQEVMKDADAKKMLDGARDGAVRNVNGRLGTEKELDFYGKPGKEFEILAPKNAIIKARLILIGNRLYQMMAISQSRDILEEKTPMFFDSFRVDGVGG